MVYVDHENSKIKLNTDFIVDSSKEPKGPAESHKCRYPEGSCSRDIWILM